LPSELPHPDLCPQIRAQGGERRRSLRFILPSKEVSKEGIGRREKGRERKQKWLLWSRSSHHLHRKEILRSGQCLSLSLSLSLSVSVSLSISLSLSRSVHLCLFQVKEILTSSSRDAWTEFVKCLDLFSREALSKREVLLLAQVDRFMASDVTSLCLSLSLCVCLCLCVLGVTWFRT
jgi:hypothetical protein